MTLATRLSFFFLVLLAVVLAGFSAALLFLAWVYLHRQVDEHLIATLNTLVAAVEVRPDGVEWEPHERLITVGGVGGEELRWTVTDEQGRRIDGSRVQDDHNPLIANVEFVADEPRTIQKAGTAWRLLQRPVTAPTAGDGKRPDDGAKKYRVLFISVAAPLAPVRATLQTWAIVLVALALVLWSGAALLGRQLCRRALAPLSRMAATARRITAADLGQRLPATGTSDEVENLSVAFNDLLARLQESFVRQQRFTGDASHQLRTPLTAMLGQVEVALRRDRGADEYRRTLTAVQGQATQMQRIVEALLFLARTDAEARAPEVQAIDLNDWLTQHLMSWADRPRRADIGLEVATPPPWARAHTTLLGQAVDCLLDNACKYSPPGSPIRLRTWHTENEAAISVEDRGPGIAAADVPHLFEPFYRAAQIRQAGIGGVGLGLAIAVRVVAALVGRIDVQTAPGSGSRFTIFLAAANPEV
jgi:heavy metal sensor kinase